MKASSGASCDALNNVTSISKDACSDDFKWNSIVTAAALPSLRERDLMISVIGETVDTIPFVALASVIDMPTMCYYDGESNLNLKVACKRGMSFPLSISLKLIYV